MDYKLIMWSSNPSLNRKYYERTLIIRSDKKNTRKNRR